MSDSSGYTAKHITVLQGLEPVRRRPAMYIGGTGSDGLHHLVWEVLDNAIDEAMAGYCDTIEIKLLPEDKVSLWDNGRGIPVDIHPQTKKTALETVMTMLHAGGKFGGEGYKVSGGLHGVGVSVVNALSSWMKTEVHRDGQIYIQEYSRGKPKGEVKKGAKTKKRGTLQVFTPDPEIFKEPSFNFQTILDHARQQAYLTKKTKISITDERQEPYKSYSFYFEGGVSSYVRHINKNRVPYNYPPVFIEKQINGISVEASLAYTDDYNEHVFCFANNILTAEGGTHLTGFRTALTRVLNDYAKKMGSKIGENGLSGDDVREGLTAVLSVKLKNPQFEGQTKARLGNPEVRPAVDSVIAEGLTIYLEEHPAEAKKIMEKCLLSAQARSAARAARETVLRKGALEGLTLPGKLADCSQKDPGKSEIYLVEGDSAGGCFAGETKIALADGRNISFKQLVKEYKKGKKNYCYTVESDSNIGIVLIENPRITKEQAEVLMVVLDNGKVIVCTPDHPFMLKNGSYKQAKDLTTEDSLMPFYRQLSRLGERITMKGYEMVYMPKETRWIFTHLLSDGYNLNQKRYVKEDGDTIHHIDFNKLNNNPDNLIRLVKEAHLQLHAQLAEKTLHRPEVMEKIKKLHKTKQFREKIRKAMTTPQMRKLLSERAKKQWENEDYKKYMVGKFLEFYNTNEQYRKRNSKMLNKIRKQYWDNSDNRRKQAERTKQYFERHPQNRELLSKIAKKQWENNDLVEWRIETTKKQWTPEFRIQRKKAYNQTYLKKALETLYKIYQDSKSINQGKYDEIRRLSNDKNLICYETICKRFFRGSELELKEAVINFNHRIKKIVRLKKKVDVYDLEVPETNNFALDSGVFVHNSAKQGRDRQFQAILPLRGKILNVERARLDKMLANEEIKSLIVGLGCGIGETQNIEKLRYHHIIIMTDADVDGAHIRTLLLTLFYRHFPQLIDKGFLYIAQPPLYAISKGKNKYYAYNEEEKNLLLKKIANVKDEVKIETTAFDVQRYKGLGEMNPEQLWETTMNPQNRSLWQVTIEEAERADEVFTMLMGEEVPPRKRFIQVHAKQVKNLDI